jgi:hypothetical protein
MSLGQSMRQTTAWSTFFPKLSRRAAAGKEAGFLLRCPGLRLLATVGSGPIRGLWVTNGVGYVVSGSEFYSLNTSYTATLIGTVSGSGPVSMADNGTQIFIACNPQGFIYNTSTGVFAQITDTDFPWRWICRLPRRLLRIQRA